ncbi:serine hydrolase domain-containing protein [Bacteroidota bacterium]
MKRQQAHICSAILFTLLILPSCNQSQNKETNLSGNSFELLGKSNPGLTAAMDSEILAGIPQKMQQFVEDGEIAGAVTLVARNGRIVSFEATGYQDLETAVPMQKHTLFRIASMTKPFVAAAIMMQVEEGKLSLDDPVEKYLPEFTDMWLIDQKSENEMQLIRPSRPITIKDILTHTSGLAGVPYQYDVKSIRENALVAARLPLWFEPGSKWQYGGEGIHAAARIVEVLSGMTYCDFLSQKIFRPLGMENTYFFLQEEHAGLLASNYSPANDGKLEKRSGSFQPVYFRPDGGLISTAQDMAIWMQTILDGGIYGDVRILSEKSVQEIIRTQTGELECGFTEGLSFGLAFGVVKQPTGVTGMLSPGTFGHGGAFGTQYWADPVTKTIYILMIQRQGFGNGDDSNIRKSFQEIAASAIID